MRYSINVFVGFVDSIDIEAVVAPSPRTLHDAHAYDVTGCKCRLRRLSLRISQDSPRLLLTTSIDKMRTFHLPFTSTHSCPRVLHSMVLRQCRKPLGHDELSRYVPTVYLSKTTFLNLLPLIRQLIHPIRALYRISSIATQNWQE